MRRMMLPFYALLSTLSVAASADAQAPPPEDARAYAVGFEAGSFILERFRTDNVELDIDALLDGISDALREQPSRLNDTRMRMLLQRLEEEVRSRDAESLMQTDPVFRALAEENLRISKAFHESFGQEDGVTTLENGLQIRVLKEGAGASPTDDNVVIVSFEAEVIDGFEFAEGEQLPLVVGDAAEGARLALLQMKPGSHWLVAIPPDLAYGLAGRAPDVGPNETILVEIELHSIGASE